MATSLSSALALAAVLQAGEAAQTPGDSTAVWRGRIAADSTDAAAWLALGQAYLARLEDFHAHREPLDTAAGRVLLDSADAALAAAARHGRGPHTADSARLLRVFGWNERAVLAWEARGAQGAADVWRGLPADLRLPPALDELGENLLRACPSDGVLLTATPLETHVAWYLRHVRALRPDLLVLPHPRWRRDTVWRRRVWDETGLRRPPSRGRRDDPWLRGLTGRRAVCASMGRDAAPVVEPRLRWVSRPLIWVTGPGSRTDRVPARDFVFAAARLALDEEQPWAGAVVAVYRRAARETPALCEALAVYRLHGEVGCR